MSRRLLDQWLRAEEHLGNDEADAALLALFEGLPAPAVPPGFADRVLARAGVPRAAELRPRDLTGVLRYLTAAALLLTGLSAAWTVPLLVSLWGRLDVATVVGALGRFLTATVHLLVDLWSLGSALGSFGRALWLLLASPQALTALCIASTIVFIGSRRLVALISSRRSPTHASI